MHTKRFFVGSTLFGILLLGGGWWFWHKSTATSQVQVFENQSLKLEPTADGAPFPVVSDRAAEVPEVMPPVAPAPSLIPPADGASLGSSVSAPPAPTLTIINQLLGFGYRSAPGGRTINTIVVHSSYNASGGDTYDLNKIIGQYERYDVGAHYLIDRAGNIYRLVQENNTAYHAGESKMPDGRKNVNAFSIGIELVATEDSGYTDKQYMALNHLIADIKTRYSIKDIVGHGDIAPQRRTDPWKFDWKRLEK